MGCMFAALWRRWFPLTDVPQHDCVYGCGASREQQPTTEEDR